MNQKPNISSLREKKKICFTPGVSWGNNVKYLGAILDKKLLFNEHISYIIHKINLTKKTLYRKSELNIVNKLLIVKTIFQTILFYAAAMWYTASNCHIKQVKKL